MADVKPVDDFEREILARHGPEALRAIRRYLEPPRPEQRTTLASTEPAVHGQHFPHRGQRRRTVSYGP